jgi:hypothetical protein
VRYVLVPLQLGRRAGDDGDARRGHRRPRTLLVAGSVQRLGRGPDEGQAGVATRRSEVGVLGQEAVPGMDRLRPRPPRRVD